MRRNRASRAAPGPGPGPRTGGKCNEYGGMGGGPRVAGTRQPILFKYIHFAATRGVFFVVKELSICSACVYFDGVKCRRSPPTLTMRDSQPAAVWVPVGPTDWCGEFKKGEKNGPSARGG